MRAGWEGNHRLQDFVRRLDSGAGLVAEVVAVEGAQLIDTAAEWLALTVPSGSREVLDRGGVQISASTSTLLAHTDAPDTQITALSSIVPFDALRIRWIGAGSESIEFHTLTARLDPRENGGNPKTAATWVGELFRVVRRDDEIEGEVQLELIGRATTEATGDVADDFDFDFRTPSGRHPVVGLPPEGQSRPETFVRIYAVQADGSLADNVAWLADSVEGSSKTDSSTYQVDHLAMIASSRDSELHEGGTVWEEGSAVGNMPYFSFSRTTHAAATVGAVGDEPIADIAGTGDLVIVARGEEWGESVLTWQIYDGTSVWVDCVDGDVLGQDNRQTIAGVEYGSDLSSIPTSGPWDLRVILTPDAVGLRSPVALDFGIERVTVTNLAGAARASDGARTLDPVTLEASLPKAVIDILKTGEQDFRDYGSNLLTQNHIGEIEVRVYVGDPSGTYLHRSEWMLHSTWDIEDYVSLADAHRLECVSPLRVLSTTQVPPFVPTSGNDGTRKAVVVSGTRKQAYDEFVDSFVGLPARRRGPGVEDTTNSVRKLIERGTALEGLDQIAYLGGQANIESQGRLKAVTIMRDEPVDYIVAGFPIGSYNPIYIGPGFKARTDEFFVRYNYEDTEERFQAERRFFIATAAEKLGGPGLNATRNLGEEYARWIITEALADLVGDRIPKHLANGAILWELEGNERNPQLEQGDVVIVETDRFVARSPITNQPIRGRLSAQAVVIDVNDFWGKRLRVWVPGYEYIAVSQGTVTYEVGPQPTVLIVDHDVRPIGADAVTGDQLFERDIQLKPNATCRSVEIEYSFVRPNKTVNQPPPSTTFDVDYDVATPGTDLLQHTLQDGAASDMVFRSQDNAGATIRDSTFVLTITPYSETGGAGGTGFAGQPQQVLVSKVGDSPGFAMRVKTPGGQEMVALELIAAATWNPTTGEVELPAAGALEVCFAVGTATASVANTTANVEWDTPLIATADISIADEEITINADGTYLFDVTVRTDSGNRTELIIHTEIDTGGGFAEETDLIVSDYVARDTDQDTGAVSAHIALELNDGDVVRFVAEGDCDGTCVLLTAGTLLRVMKAA